MTTADPELARPLLGGMIATWVLALAGGLAIAVLIPHAAQAGWFALAMGLVVPIAFAFQLAYGRASGFILRTAASVLGALVVLGVVAGVAWIIDIQLGIA